MQKQMEGGGGWITYDLGEHNRKRVSMLFELHRTLYNCICPLLLDWKAKQ